MSFECISIGFSQSVSKSQVTFATKGPIYPPARQPYPRDILAKVLIQRWAPRYQLEAKSVVEHGEPARCKYHAPTVDTPDVLAFG